MKRSLIMSVMFFVMCNITFAPPPWIVETDGTNLYYGATTNRQYINTSCNHQTITNVNAIYFNPSSILGADFFGYIGCSSAEHANVQLWLTASTNTPGATVGHSDSGTILLFNTNSITSASGNVNIYAGLSVGNIELYAPAGKISMNADVDMNAKSITNSATIEANSATITHNFVVDTNTFYVDGTTHRVGIGTVTPAYGLTIETDIGIANSRRFWARDASGGYEQFLWPRWSDNVMYLNYGSAGFNIRNNSSVSTMFLTANNKVGIGTTTPAYTLDVNGNAKFSGGITNTSSVSADRIYCGGNTVMTGLVAGAGIAVGKLNDYTWGITNTGAFVETDPVFTNWNATSHWANVYITNGLASTNWVKDYAYPLVGNPSNFLTSYTEIDPVFTNWWKTNQIVDVSVTGLVAGAGIAVRKIDAHTWGITNTCTYYDGGDPANSHWSKANFTLNYPNWYVLIVTNVIPADAKAAVFNIYVQAASAGQVFEIRPYGNTNTWNRQSAITQAANTWNSVATILTINNGRIEYRGHSSLTYVYVTVTGYFK
jgi:hypothetical protein